MRQPAGLRVPAGGAVFLEGLRVIIRRVLRHAQITSSNELSSHKRRFLITKEVIVLQITQQEFVTKDC